jgi:hypothetical protein
MTPHRTIIPIVALLVALSGATPSAAPAKSLLSGYGGPGQGSQAILGATLLNGPSGGGGSSGSPPGVQTGSGNATPNGGVVREPGKRSAGRTRRGTTAGGGGRGVAGHTSGGAASIYPASSGAGASQQAGDSQTLGITGEDVLLILLVVGVLACTGLLTRRLTPTPRGRKARSR